jgi:hypothetical protein
MRAFTACGSNEMAVQLPTGWVITKTLEMVPSPIDIGQTEPRSLFTRWTYICTNGAGDYVCSSGSEPDCESQALSMAQARTQQTVTT